MDNDLSLETTCAHPLHQTASDRRNGGIRHAKPKDIRFQLGAIQGGRNNNFMQRDPRQTEGMDQRTTPITRSDDGNAALQYSLARALQRTDDRMVL